MSECITCHRVLKNDAALLQHCRDKGHPYRSPLVARQAAAAPAPAPVPASTSSAAKSASTSTAIGSSSTLSPPAYECKVCSVSFRDKATYDQHNASKHAPKPFKCAPCGLEFSSADALSIHFRHFPVHPKCPQCNSAFVDQTQLKLHQAAHPKCAQCDSVFLNKVQLEEHYRESGSHPVCFVCGEGFANDSMLDKHLSSAHLEGRCRLCDRQFRSAEELQNHYHVSSAHPHCALCEVGFADDEACDKVCRASWNEICTSLMDSIAYVDEPPATPSPDPIAAT
ncbi:hypothetical protein BD310DRAFT_821527 [Dichomitus squalens]|uniref:C2H2-type domain-containing protein n=1 Tax=Dichomitus squalens TaxID=114155 RepID=A0A4V2K7T8_9APHY|nr:hypothetical protein BD310DRAFT_821527 [Dichomitus squalens]